MVATKPPRLLPPADAGKVGIQPGTALGVMPPRPTPPGDSRVVRSCDEPIRSHAHAAAALDDAEYVGYIMLEMFKLGAALVKKRWPRLG